VTWFQNVSNAHLLEVKKYGDTHITMPQETRREDVISSSSGSLGKHNMYILQSLLLRHTSGGMPMQRTKVLSQLPLSLDVEILLIAEEDNSSCCYQSCNIIFLCRGEGSKVDACDFCADSGVEIADGGCSGGEGGE
jgi:hypothetical protein